MTAFQAHLSEKSGFRHRLLPLVALVCLALLVVLSFAQVSHLHQSATDADHCQLCIVMHTAVPVAASPAIVVLVHLGAFAQAAEPIAIARQRQSRLFIRPPPISC